MKILILGNGGQLGFECQRTMSLLGEVVGLDYPQIDFSKPEMLRKIIMEQHPNLIVNCAAYTAVDQAESDVERCHLINAVAPGVLAETALSQRVPLIHISTDYVFDGTSSSPCKEDDIAHPISVYGTTKLEGEKAIQQIGGAFIILRTAWLYSLWKDSFVIKVLKWSRQKETIRIVADQIGNPTPAYFLAQSINLVSFKARSDLFGYFMEHSGIYHAACSTYASRYEWAKAIVQLDPFPEQQVLKSLQPAKSDEFLTPAKRPLFSALDCTKLHQTFGVKLPGWQEGLTYMMQSWAKTQILQA